MTKLEKTAVYFSIGIIIVMIFLIAFSEHGVFDYKEFKTKETAVLEQVRKVQAENQVLESEIQRLKTDIEYIKHIAKHEHDMVEEEELIFKDQSDKRNKP
ncbi:MAG: septum formation initiator family protein [Pseudomonadota bacterium]